MAERATLVLGMEAMRTRLVAAKAKPYLDEYQQQIDAVDAKLESREAVIREELAATNKRIVEQQAELRQEQLSARIKMLDAQEQDLANQLAALEAQAIQPSAGGTGQRSVDIEMLQVDIRTTEAVLSRVADEIERIKVEQTARETEGEEQQQAGQGAKDRDRIQVIAEASAPQAADPRTQIFRAGGAAGAGLILPFVLLVWWDARKRRINTPAELTSQLRVSMLGSLPLVPNRVMRQLGGPSKQAHFWRNLLSESVDSIAAVILSDPEPRRVIMVSSATAGEGKTTLAGHLAISLAAGADRRTLLIDFDLRRPALHRIFGLEAGPGVGEVLRGELSVQDALQETDIPKLHLISAGTAKQRGLGLLGSSSALAALFEELRSSFDFILVDGCPILPVVDTRLVAQHADAVILSVLRDVSRAPKVSAACEILESFKIPLLGVVMTGSSSDIYQEIAADRYLEVQPVE
jgi:capsular exopolysaccharide synthesis family protein